MSPGWIHKHGEGIALPAWSRPEEAAKQTEGCFRWISRDAAIPERSWNRQAFVLIVVKPPDQLERRRTGAREKRLEELDNGQEINGSAMHRYHARHETGAVEVSIFQQIERILAVSNRRLSCRAD